MSFFKLFYLGLITIYKKTFVIARYFLIGLVVLFTIFPKYFIIGLQVIFKKKKLEKTSVQSKKLSMAIIGLSLTVYLICVFLGTRWYVQGLKISKLSKDIIESTEIIEKEEKEENSATPVEEQKEEVINQNVYYPNDYWDYMNVPFMNVNFNELLAKNPDTVGWIKVDGTKVNYPVVQSTDNDFYLHHAFNRRNNAGGWVFADYRVDFEDFGRNTIIYGHNMNNKTMFGSIPSMLYSGYLSNSSNYYIKISTPTCNTVWKLFSIYTIEPEVYYLKTNFKSEPFATFIANLKARSIYDFGIEVTENDKILTLSTCDNSGTKRVAVHAKMVNIEYK